MEGPDFRRRRRGAGDLSLPPEGMPADRLGEGAVSFAEPLQFLWLILLFVFLGLGIWSVNRGKRAVRV